MLNSKNTFKRGGVQVNNVPRNYCTDRNIQQFWATERPNNPPKEEINIQEPLLDANYAKSVLVREVIKLIYLTSEGNETVKCPKINQDTVQDINKTWMGKLIKLEIKKESKPCYGKQYKIPQAYRKVVNIEIARFSNIGLLARITETEWAAPDFVIPKRDDTVRFLRSKQVPETQTILFAPNNGHNSKYELV